MWTDLALGEKESLCQTAEMHAAVERHVITEPVVYTTPFPSYRTNSKASLMESRFNHAVEKQTAAQCYDDDRCASFRFIDKKQKLADYHRCINMHITFHLSVYCCKKPHSTPN